MNAALKFLWRSTKSIGIRIAGVFVVPVALLMGGADDRLPAWAQPWDNDREPFGDTARNPAIVQASGLKKMWLRYVWLGWRNPANNFARSMGIPDAVGDVLETHGNQNTSDQGEAGWKFNRLRRADGEVVAFEFYLVCAYSSTRCLRIRLGWKLWDEPMNPLVHVINPFMSFTGKR